MSEGGQVLERGRAAIRVRVLLTIGRSGALNGDRMLLRISRGGGLLLRSGGGWFRNGRDGGLLRLLRSGGGWFRNGRDGGLLRLLRNGGGWFGNGRDGGLLRLLRSGGGWFRNGRDGGLLRLLRSGRHGRDVRRCNLQNYTSRISRLGGSCLGFFTCTYRDTQET